MAIRWRGVFKVEVIYPSQVDKPKTIVINKISKISTVLLSFIHPSTVGVNLVTACPAKREKRT